MMEAMNFTDDDRKYMRAHGDHRTVGVGLPRVCRSALDHIDKIEAILAEFVAVQRGFEELNRDTPNRGARGDALKKRQSEVCRAAMEMLK